jgi:hypothetical protein
MSVLLETSIKRFAGLSSDTKPTSVPPGSYFWESDTNILYKTYDGTNWVSQTIKSFVTPTTIDLKQVAGDYTLYTGTTADVYIEAFSLTLPNVNCADDAALTSISVQTDTATVITLISATAGAVANLTANKAFAYSTPFYLPATKLIQLTIAGGAADAATVCTVKCRWTPVVPGGYLAV